MTGGDPTDEDRAYRDRLYDELTALRVDHGLDQRSLARLMGTTQSAVSEYESGTVEPSLAVIQRWCRALGFQFRVVLVPVVTQTRFITAHDEEVIAYGDLASTLRQLAQSPPEDRSHPNE